ncbi:hypothetical protein CEXT_507071 [Caerostris extrusa]|uniref:LAGLIDADG homing endonuclease n=1 Tax=Caerostris extrusa TaxID=172846 RepID=A0AAV4US88_CAEEX|nr:hypothetical protein CEXT_507071 [Caerostris extrusa]
MQPTVEMECENKTSFSGKDYSSNNLYLPNIQGNQIPERNLVLFTLHNGRNVFVDEFLSEILFFFHQKKNYRKNRICSRRKIEFHLVLDSSAFKRRIETFVTELSKTYM